jgi:hypothetical protein
MPRNDCLHRAQGYWRLRIGNSCKHINLFNVLHFKLEFAGHKTKDFQGVYMARDLMRLSQHG